MKRCMRVWRIVFVAVIGALMPAGCASTTVSDDGKTTATYSLGTLESVVDATPGRVIEAAQAALAEMNIPVINHSSDDAKGDLTARTAQDEKVTIKARTVSATTSRCTIRVGALGDEALSRAIFAKIKNRL